MKNQRHTYDYSRPFPATCIDCGVSEMDDHTKPCNPPGFIDYEVIENHPLITGNDSAVVELPGTYKVDVQGNPRNPSQKIKLFQNEYEPAILGPEHGVNYQEPKCDCGAAKCNLPFHSHWCSTQEKK